MNMRSQWPWTMTFDPSSPNRISLSTGLGWHLCLFWKYSLKTSLRYHITDGWTDTQMDGQPENITPPATALAGVDAQKWHHHVSLWHTCCSCFSPANIFRQVTWCSSHLSLISKGAAERKRMKKSHHYHTCSSMLSDMLTTMELGQSKTHNIVWPVKG